MKRVTRTIVIECQDSDAPILEHQLQQSLVPNKDDVASPNPRITIRCTERKDEDLP